MMMASYFMFWLWFVWRIWCMLKIYVIGLVALAFQMISKHNKMPVHVDEDGLVAIVTGGASGIGLQITRILTTKNNMHVIIACRSREEARKAIDGIKSELSIARVEYMHLDLSSLASVREFVTEFHNRDLPLNLLINNAGVMFVPYSETTDGLEEHFQVNYFAHLTLTSLLLPLLKQSALDDQYSRVVNVSSVTHCAASYEDIQPNFAEVREYSPHAAYVASKLAIIMATYKLSEELKESKCKVTVNALHPGVINSDLYKHLHWSIKWVIDVIRMSFFKTTKEGAESVVYVALSPDLETMSGGYYDNCKVAKSSSISYSKALQDDLWDKFKSL
ncbi:dehydrogenase/reductase SDR family member on chromosome X-like [Gigantopelta aegis]|uniref:dehydrogenase/reductase SDR family member on chromosome X-like n=1 Tax=Gigantopelta aegis TaxID=1735272 RepID=UPI001B88B695|nr:dehydrogenase/reductase SDR family member on chromosome X-like [Gigantopelta aegis]